MKNNIKENIKKNIKKLNIIKILKKILLALILN